jgi:L-fucose isomerase-like protein
MARTIPEEVTNGTLEGDLIPGEATIFRLQSTSDGKLRAYVAEGEILPVRTRSFGAIGIFGIPEMGRFYRHVLVQRNYPHHAAITFHHNGKLLFDVFKFLGVNFDQIDYNHPAGVLYKSENPFA